ncbi:MAG: hypothetical protein KIT84_02945 [Labilithrix sp.]|nr:hypothetical protein [Labilithrix sp.]MCW5809939.1 hypothetical protein [Labilithrix sp.]
MKTTGTPFDQLAKETWLAILAHGATVKEQLEVRARSQWVDLMYVPDPARLGELAAFGLAERLAAEGPGLLEFFHRAPSVEDVLRCMQKQIELRRRRKSRREAPRLWLLCGGCPSKALRELGFVRDVDWPEGVYRGAPGFLVRLVVAGELPATRETLLLRLLGAGRVLRDAFAELRALPRDAPERGLALDIVLRLLPEARESQTQKAREFLMVSQEFVEQWKRELIEQGVAQGREEGREEGVEKGMRETLELQLEKKFGALGVEVGGRLRAASHEEIVRWLERILVARSIDEVLDG